MAWMMLENTRRYQADWMRVNCMSRGQVKAEAFTLGWVPQGDSSSYRTRHRTEQTKQLTKHLSEGRKRKRSASWVCNETIFLLRSPMN